MTTTFVTTTLRVRDGDDDFESVTATFPSNPLLGSLRLSVFRFTDTATKAVVGRC